MALQEGCTSKYYRIMGGGGGLKRSKKDYIVCEQPLTWSHSNEIIDNEVHFSLGLFES